MTEPFDPAAYRHEHAPNETCDVCALLTVIEGLQIELKLSRIGWQETESMLTWANNRITELESRSQPLSPNAKTVLSSIMRKTRRRQSR